MTLTLLPPPPPSPPTTDHFLPPYTDNWKEFLKYKDKRFELAQIGHNVRVLLSYDPDYRGNFRWNTVTLKVEVHGGIFTNFIGKDVSIDHLVSTLQDHLAYAHDLHVNRNDIGHRLVEIAQENSYDPIQNWLSSLRWDGIPRLNDWLITYAGAENKLGNENKTDHYTHFIGRRWFLSIVARAFQPGCKADDVLVAEGLQGAHKSTLFSILGGPWFAEGAGALGDKDSKMLISTALLVELPDMAAFSKADQNAMKAFFTLQNDRFRPPYGKDIISIKRRAVFAATTNDEEYFTDPTGNRRYRPVKLGIINRAALIRDRDQIFAEAVVLWNESKNCNFCAQLPVVVPGETPRCPQHAWWLTPEEEKIAKTHAEFREEQDAWEIKIFEFTTNPKKATEINANTALPLTTANILIHGLDFRYREIQRRDEMRVAVIMKKLGYIRPQRGKDAVWTTKVR